eukprot:jgi/Galph1/4962/GphlegSOOS_G3623.1
MNSNQRRVIKGGEHIEDKDEGQWIFGYGSLVWKANFPYNQHVKGCVKGWCRRFWQGSVDHRGTLTAPGRVVTLAPAEKIISMKQAYPSERMVTWGVAYFVTNENLDQVLEYLDYREKNGYTRVFSDVYASEEDDIPVVHNALLYIASETNPQWLGPCSEREMVKHIFKSEGPSGSNSEYFQKLVESIRSFGVYDPHLESLKEAWDCEFV